MDVILQRVYFGERSPGIHGIGWTGDWEGPKTSLDVIEKTNCIYQETNPVDEPAAVHFNV
jgi:hypothetical protein